MQFVYKYVQPDSVKAKLLRSEGGGRNFEKTRLRLFRASVREQGNDLPESKYEAKEDFSPVGPIVREIIWLK